MGWLSWLFTNTGKTDKGDRQTGRQADRPPQCQNHSWEFRSTM